MRSARATEQQRALVFGSSGQDGVLLGRLLESKGYKVFSVGRSSSAAAITCDIRDSRAVGQLIEETQPHEIYNLAAISSVADSWTHPADVVAVNCTAVASMLDTIRVQPRAAEIRFYQASSSEMFGVPDTKPQTERTAMRPHSPYATAKTAAHHLVGNYRDGYGLFATSGILFNHESPLRPERFVTRKITKAVAAIVQGKADHLDLATLDVSRDWGYAGDYVEAMWLMLQADTPSDYVIATGELRTIRDLVTVAFEAAGVSQWEPYVRLDEKLKRPTDVTDLVGDASKARSELGWKPKRTFDQLIGEMVRADLAR